MPTCKGVCHRYKAELANKITSPYEYGNRCQRCELWVEKKYAKCPCCSSRLRHKPNRSLGKEKLKKIGLKNK